MKKQKTRIREQGLGIGCWCVIVLALMTGAARGQGIQFGEASAAHKGHVALLSDEVQVIAGSPQVVELRFRVDPGFHINSHTPKDELLIPTVLKLDAAAGVKIVGEEYPAGSTFRLAVGGAGEMLDVYQGEFRVSVRMVAPKGASTLTGVLHYQACGSASCFPPRTLPVMIAVSGE